MTFSNVSSLVPPPPPPLPTKIQVSLPLALPAALGHSEQWGIQAVCVITNVTVVTEQQA